MTNVPPIPQGYSRRPVDSEIVTVFLQFGHSKRQIGGSRFPGSTITCEPKAGYIRTFLLLLIYEPARGTPFFSKDEEKLYRRATMRRPLPVDRLVPLSTSAPTPLAVLYEKDPSYYFIQVWGKRSHCHRIFYTSSDRIYAYK